MEVFPDSTQDALRCAALTQQQAEAIFEQGRGAVVFALLELTLQLAEARGPQTTPSTPSGMAPVYEKPPRNRERIDQVRKKATPAAGGPRRNASTGRKRTSCRTARTAADD